eukprot:TRINITY_DN5972_c0_g1_i1.p1 TRINITY_DN5972_c0_g1~~TRINITY_DN5972_c0_g1_i1.p1  ORF type:complete len:514 (+),score=113.18 TRINITY_DN5972_c0_g1_i1:135-1544(+)
MSDILKAHHDHIYAAATGQTVKVRKGAVLLHLDPSPIVCRANTVPSLLYQYDDDDSGNRTEIRATLHRTQCSCSVGFHQVGDVCVENAKPLPASVLRALIIVPLLSVASLLIGYLAFQHRLTMARTVAVVDYLAADNQALEQAWDMDMDDLQLGSRIAGGAFGDVHHVEYKHGFCIKLLKVDMTMLPSEMEDFKQEVRFLKRIRHPNVVRFYGAGVGRQNGDDVPFLLLERAELGSLKDIVRSNSEAGGISAPTVDWTLRVQLMRDVAQGLAYIHSLGPEVMHRDLKTANVLVFEREGGGMVAKVADFGSVKLKGLQQKHNMHKRIAHHRRSGPSGSGMLDSSSALSSVSSDQREQSSLTKGIGTPLYMAPEMLLGSQQYTQAVDVFSFGVMMWEVASQQSPDLIVQTRGPKARWGLVILSELLEQGHRLELDDSYAEWYRVLMERCSVHDPAGRVQTRVLAKIMAQHA